ncbi:MAG: hypothetical protein L0226_16040 [Acidobacteria bacterium]|nr:hypothetical protein [Acidobacteriota bacterium]
MIKPTWLSLALLLAISVIAQAQVAQPYITSISPLGAKRGSIVTFTVDGFNLGGASEIVWNKPGITAKIKLNSELLREPPMRANPTSPLIIDKASKNRLTIEAAISPDIEPGFYFYRIRTPLGTTNLGRIAVGALPESKEREMNDSVAEAQALSLPTTVAGDLQKRGDNDYFKFQAKSGQQLVFEVIASMINSRLDSVLALMDDKGQILATNNDFDARRDSLLAYTFKRDGEYIIRLSDFERKGQTGLYGYHLNIGDFPYVTDVFPLGVKQGTASEVTVAGFNLGTDRAKVNASAGNEWGAVKILKLETARGQAFNNTRFALGHYPEFIERALNSTLANPQDITVPATINGRIFNDKSPVDEDFYRFKARKGQHLVLEVEAQRYGSPLDSVIEVLDIKGNQIPRLLVRCLLETQLTLNDRDSTSRGFRILSWNGIFANDYMLAGNELLQVEVLPKSPDEDISFKSFLGQRLTYEDTTAEAHAVNSSVYKVSLHPPGTNLPSNGLPLVTIYYRNDDGGPIYGKDSKLNFIAPEDGEYIVRIRDMRGMQGDRFAYRLSIHEPAADFVLFADPENPNVPQGGHLPVTITAYRNDGFDGEIKVTMLGLPPGYNAGESVIRPGQNSTVIVIGAANDAAASSPLRIQGTATINGRTITHQVNTEDRISIVSAAPPPELLVWTEPQRVTLEPGGQAWVTIKIKRERGFAGRVPFDVRNLPHGVIVKDVGLNGVMITEEEITQRFQLAAEMWVKPMEQPVFVVGRIETTSPQRSDFPASPFTLIIQSKDNKERALR